MLAWLQPGRGASPSPGRRQRGPLRQWADSASVPAGRGTARGDVSCRGKARARLQLLAPLQVPSALLTFSWDAAVLEDIRAAGAELDSSILKPELLAAIEKLS